MLFNMFEHRDELNYITCIIRSLITFLHDSLMNFSPSHAEAIKIYIFHRIA